MLAKQLEGSLYQDPGVAVTGLSRTQTSGSTRDRPQILKDLDLSRVRLFTNKLTKVVGLRSLDLEITERVSIEVEPNSYGERTLRWSAKSSTLSSRNTGRTGAPVLEVDVCRLISHQKTQVTHP